VVTAETAEDAFEMYKKHMPDITFLDIDLPDGNGNEVLEKIKEIDENAFIVMLTGSQRTDDVNKAISNQVAGYIVKPLTREKVEHYLRKYLKHREYIMGTTLGNKY